MRGALSLVGLKELRWGSEVKSERGKGRTGGLMRLEGVSTWRNERRTVITGNLSVQVLRDSFIRYRKRADEG